MAKKQEIPHLSEWKVVSEKFTGTWQVGDSGKYVLPLMERARCQMIDGIMHIVHALELDYSQRIDLRSESGRALWYKHRFLLETLHAAQQEAASALPQPKCMEPINIFEQYKDNKIQQR